MWNGAGGGKSRCRCALLCLATQASPLSKFRALPRIIGGYHGVVAGRSHFVRYSSGVML